MAALRETGTTGCWTAGRQLNASNLRLTLRRHLWQLSVDYQVSPGPQPPRSPAGTLQLRVVTPPARVNV